MLWITQLPTKYTLAPSGNRLYLYILKTATGSNTNTLDRLDRQTVVQIYYTKYLTKARCPGC
jgi:hypothetical protein